MPEDEHESAFEADDALHGNSSNITVDATAAPVELVPMAAAFENSGPSMDVLRETLGFGVVFNEEFKILRPYLSRISKLWPDQVRNLLLQNKDIAGHLTHQDYMEMERLMLKYARQINSGRFYEGFFNCVVDISEFFTERNIDNWWVIGTFMNVFHETQLGIFFDREARNGRVVVAGLRCLLKIMTLTLQILHLLAAKRQQSGATGVPAAVPET